MAGRSFSIQKLQFAKLIRKQMVNAGILQKPRLRQHLAEQYDQIIECVAACVVDALIETGSPDIQIWEVRLELRTFVDELPELDTDSHPLLEMAFTDLCAWVRIAVKTERRILE